MIRLTSLLITFIASVLFPVISQACEIDGHDLKQVQKNISPKKGEWLLVQAWTLDCAICERQKPDLSNLNIAYSDMKVVNLSLDGLTNIEAVRSRVSENSYSMSNYVSELDAFRSVMDGCFGKQFMGTPTYILYNPQAEVMAVRTGPLDLSALPEQLKLTKK